MKTRAAPGFSGRRSRSSVNASRPPAEAPNPATGHNSAVGAGGGSAAATGFALSGAGFRLATDFGVAFGGALGWAFLRLIFCSSSLLYTTFVRHNVLHLRFVSRDTIALL